MKLKIAIRRVRHGHFQIDLFVFFHDDESTGNNILNQFMKDHKMFMNNSDIKMIKLVKS